MPDPGPSPHGGMGAVPTHAGTSFRVWAPHASQVHVAGTFNDWSATSDGLAAEGRGYWSVEIHGAKPGDEYKFVIRNGDSEIWRNDPYAKHVTNSVGQSIIHSAEFDWSATSFQMVPRDELVIYELHIGTFNDAPGGAPGNLDGASAKLPYLRDLGITAIKMMPPTEFAGGFSWGYNPANLFAVESDYGGPDAFKRFVDAAHQHDIAVIFDVVYNHFGPSDLDLWRFDGWYEGDGGGIYFYSDWRVETPWGPRPDYGRPEVRQYIRDNALMWLEEYRVDGLRWDATYCIRNAHGNNHDPASDLPDGWRLMRDINAEIKARQPWKISIAEDLQNNPWLTKDNASGGAGFDAQWDAGFVHPIREAIIASDDGARDMHAVRAAIEHRYNGRALSRIVYTESHDEVANGQARVPEEIWHGNAASWSSKKRSTLGAALVFTAPGIPMIFQGQELLEDQWFHDQDPVDWSKQQTYSGIVQLYRDLIRLRRNWHDNTRGLRGEHVHVHHVNHGAKLIAYHRWQNGGPRDDVVVVANLSHRAYASYTLGFPREGRWRVRFNSDWRGYDPAFGDHHSYDAVARRGGHDGMPCHGEVGIGSYSALILSQDS